MSNQEIIWNNEYYKNPEKWRKERLSLPNILKNKKILEVGVGNGKNLRTILNQNPKSVTAIDISSNVVKSIKLKGIKLLTEDIRGTSFNTKNFDIIICYYVLNNMLKKDRLKSVREMKRILDDKGIILFEDFLKGDYRQNSLGKKIESNTILRKNGIIEHFFTEKELNVLFKDFKKLSKEKIIYSPIRTNKKSKRKLINLVLSKR